MADSKRKRKTPTYKTKVAVVGPNLVQGQCGCTWTGNKLSGKTSLFDAIVTAEQELDDHKHLEKK